MEEKWWKKFQTKDLKDTNNSFEQSNIDNEEINNEEQASTDDTIKGSEVFSEAINFIQDLGESIGKTIDEETNKVMEDENIKNIINDINEKAQETSNKISQTTMDFINSEEVKKAAQKAQDVMKDVVNEVKSWTGDEVPYNFTEDNLYEDKPMTTSNDIQKYTDPFENDVKSESEIVKDFESAKELFDQALNSDVLKNVKAFTEDKIDEVKDVAKNTMSKPGVEKSIAYINDKASETIKSVEETLEKPNVKAVVENAKQKAEDVKSWAYEVYNKEEIQEGVKTAVVKSKEAVDKIKNNVEKIVVDPKVNSYYVDGKKVVVKSVKNVDEKVRKVVGPIYVTDSLKSEAVEWKDSAIHFTKQTVRLAAKTAQEVKDSEQMQRAVSYTKKATKTLYLQGRQRLKEVLNNKTNKEVKSITLNEEQHHDGEEE